MKVYVLIDHVCEADMVCGVYSSRELAQQALEAATAKDQFCFEGEEIKEFDLDAQC